MKINNSKKQLAEIIHENGGWRDDAKWSVQHKTGGRVVFTKSKYKPEFSYGCWDGFGTFYGGFVTQKVLPNWHQTILSSEEYFHLYPMPDADGWIEWVGEECPVGEDDRIDIKFSDGATLFGVDSDWDWGDRAGYCNIIAYRPHKPVKSLEELCGEVKEENMHEHVEAKPTIEQLAADYRNRKDYADRKQQEADAAKADAEDKLAELVAAGKAIGLVLRVADAEPELVITDWRDLQLNDIIEYVDGDIKGKIGMTGPVVEFAPGATDGMMVRMKCDNGPHKGRFGWPRKWRFIHRPAK